MNKLELGIILAVIVIVLSVVGVFVHFSYPDCDYVPLGERTFGIGWEKECVSVSRFKSELVRVSLNPDVSFDIEDHTKNGFDWHLNVSGIAFFDGLFSNKSYFEDGHMDGGWNDWNAPIYCPWDEETKSADCGNLNVVIKNYEGYDYNCVWPLPKTRQQNYIHIDINGCVSFFHVFEFRVY